MKQEQIKFIMETFKLDEGGLAKTLNVTPYTVDRWLKKTNPNLPTGLQREVLQGLYNAALEIRRKKDKEAEKAITALVALGIGALIFFLLTKSK
ncbi:MAG: hypothetical protein L0Y74_11445 [candidate division Zixibacteria bacterium]|nr:hypothetical protein [candidate division Zixibacteria bacterium]MCI0532538.1 hypothetical protein [candidate division Zixibacteria bacterium]